jgi:hypothetical protein
LGLINFRRIVDREGVVIEKGDRKGTKNIWQEKMI